MTDAEIKTADALDKMARALQRQALQLRELMMTHDVSLPGAFSDIESAAYKCRKAEIAIRFPDSEE